MVEKRFQVRDVTFFIERCDHNSVSWDLFLHGEKTVPGMRCDVFHLGEVITIISAEIHFYMVGKRFQVWDVMFFIG